MDILCALWQADVRGSKSLALAGWAGEVGKTVNEIAPILRELGLNRTADISECKGLITITNRRMVREAKLAVRELHSTGLNLSVEQAVSLQWVLSQWKLIPGVVQPLQITNLIRTRIIDMIALHQDRAWWLSLFRIIQPSDFLCGRTDVDFRASLDWVLSTRNLDKIMAGNYVNGAAKLAGRVTSCQQRVRQPGITMPIACGKPAIPGDVKCQECKSAKRGPDGFVHREATA